jgi:hypothetical protein
VLNLKKSPTTHKELPQGRRKSVAVDKKYAEQWYNRGVTKKNLLYDEVELYC